MQQRTFSSGTRARGTRFLFVLACCGSMLIFAHFPSFVHSSEDQLQIVGRTEHVQSHRILAAWVVDREAIRVLPRRAQHSAGVEGYDKGGLYTLLSPQFKIRLCFLRYCDLSEAAAVVAVLLIATRADDPAVAVHSAIVPYHNYKRMRYCVYYRVPTFG